MSVKPGPWSSEELWASYNHAVATKMHPNLAAAESSCRALRMQVGINTGNDVWGWFVSDEKTLREALKRIAAESAPIHSAIEAIHASRRKRPNMWPEGR
jgi:hypothetical protein